MIMMYITIPGLAAIPLPPWNFQLYFPVCQTAGYFPKFSGPWPRFQTGSLPVCGLFFQIQCPLVPITYWEFASLGLFSQIQCPLAPVSNWEFASLRAIFPYSESLGPCFKLGVCQSAGYFPKFSVPWPWFQTGSLPVCGLFSRIQCPLAPVSNWEFASLWAIFPNSVSLGPGFKLGVCQSAGYFPEFSVPWPRFQTGSLPVCWLFSQIQCPLAPVSNWGFEGSNWVLKPGPRNTEFGKIASRLANWENIVERNKKHDTCMHN